MNNTTRKHPRTLQEAFGPYTSHRIDDHITKASYSKAWWIALYSIAAVALVVIANTGPV